MGIVIRQSIVTTIISYIGVVIGFVNVVYLYPRFLEAEQIGLLRTLQDAAILFSPFAQVGIAQSILKYYPYFANDKQKSGSFLSFTLLFSLAGFALFFIVFMLFKSSIVQYFETNAPQLLEYTSLLLWLTLFLMLTSVLEAYSRSLLKTVVPNLLKEVIIRLSYAGLVALYFLGHITFDEFINSTVIASLVCLVILIIYLASQGNLKLASPGTSLKHIPEGLFTYSLVGFAGTAGLIIIGKVDSLMVSAYLGLASNAIYTTAFYMATVIEIPKRALSQVAMPLIARSFEKNNITEIESIYKKTAINQFIVGSLLLLGVWSNIDSIFMLMPKSATYEAGKYVVLIVGLGKLADMFFGPSSEIIVLSKHYGFNILLILMLALIIVVSNQVLIPRYGIEGAATGAALTLMIFNFVKFVFLWARMKIQPFSVAFIKVGLIVALTWTANHFIPRAGPVLLDMAVRSAAITGIFVPLILLTNVSPEANALTRKIATWVTLKTRNH